MMDRLRELWCRLLGCKGSAPSGSVTFKIGPVRIKEGARWR